MSKRWKAATAEFVWHGDHPDIESAVRKDLAIELVDLRRAEDLVFHDCWLEGDPYGPSVLVWGLASETCLHCEYHAAETNPQSAPQLPPQEIASVDSPASQPMPRATVSGSPLSRSALLAGSDGNPSIPSPEAGGAKMDGNPDRAAKAVTKSANSGQAVTGSPISEQKP